MSGILYLCATPIGNLEDMTMRAVRILKEVDLIAAEDTRNSIKLLNHFEIHTPMTSYHEFNKYEKGRYLVGLLLEGKNIALITDAGTPGISDPGEELVRMAHEAGVTVTALPGACAAVNALVLSGLPTRRFCFEAFLPADKKERREVLEELKEETRTIVLYEAPHRLLRTLQELFEELGDRSLTVVRELTKKHEAVSRALTRRDPLPQLSLPPSVPSPLKYNAPYVLQAAPHTNLPVPFFLYPPCLRPQEPAHIPLLAHFAYNMLWRRTGLSEKQLHAFLSVPLV